MKVGDILIAIARGDLDHGCEAIRQAIEARQKIRGHKLDPCPVGWRDPFRCRPSILSLAP